MSTQRRTYIPISWHSGGCQYSQGDLVQVPFKKYLHGGRLNFSGWLLALAFLFLDTLLVWFGFRCRFRTIVTLMPETALVSLRTLPLFFPLVTNTFFLFQHHVIPCDSWPLHTFFSIFSCLASKFRNLSFWSILLFTIVFGLWLMGIDIFWWISMSYNFKTVFELPGLTYS